MSQFLLPSFLAAGSGLLDFLGAGAQNRAIASSAEASLRQNMIAELDANRRRAAQYFRDTGSVDAIAGSANVEGQSVTNLMMQLVSDTTADTAATDANARAQRIQIINDANARMQSPLLALITGALQGFASGLGLQQGISALSSIGTVTNTSAGTLSGLSNVGAGGLA